MAWVRIDDQLSDHPKIVAAGPDAAWLFITGLCYASRYLTDGFIPEAQVRRLSDVKNPSAAAKRLVSNGLWDVVEGGYMIHDYLDYNTDAETIKEHRKRNAERQSRHRDKQKDNAVSNSVSNSVSNAVTEDVSNAVSNGPVTVPQSQSPIESTDVLSCDVDPEAPETVPVRAVRPPDPLFEAIAEAWTGQPYRADLLTRSQSGLVGKATAELRAVGATPVEVHHEWGRIKAVFDNPTPSALAKHWKADLSGKRSEPVVRTEDIYPRLA